MDVERVAAQLDAAAVDSEPATADRFLLVYIGDAGLVVHRVRHGTHVLSGVGEKHSFRRRIEGAIDALWPELSGQMRRTIGMAADMLAHSPIARMMTGGK